MQKAKARSAELMLAILSSGHSSYAAPSQGFGVPLYDPEPDPMAPYLLAVGVLSESLKPLLYAAGAALLAANMTHAYLRVRHIKSERFDGLYRGVMKSFLNMIILGIAGYCVMTDDSGFFDPEVMGVSLYMIVYGSCVILEIALAVHIMISVIGYPLRAAKDKTAQIER